MENKASPLLQIKDIADVAQYERGKGQPTQLQAVGRGAVRREGKKVGKEVGVVGERFQVGFISLLSKGSSNFTRGIKRREELVEGVEGRPALFREKSLFMGTRNRKEVFPVNKTNSSKFSQVAFTVLGHQTRARDQLHLVVSEGSLASFYWRFVHLTIWDHIPSCLRSIMPNLVPQFSSFQKELRLGVSRDFETCTGFIYLFFFIIYLGGFLPNSPSQLGPAFKSKR